MIFFFPYLIFWFAIFFDCWLFNYNLFCTLVAFIFMLIYNFWINILFKIYILKRGERRNFPPLNLERGKRKTKTLFKFHILSVFHEKLSIKNYFLLKERIFQWYLRRCPNKHIVDPWYVQVATLYYNISLFRDV